MKPTSSDPHRHTTALLKRTLLNRRAIGLILATLGFLFPLVFDLPGLDFPGRIALGIFIMAACLWMFESVPIWGTSLFVILLQVVLLSNVSPWLQNVDVVPETLRAAPGVDDSTVFQISPGALSDGGEVWRRDADGGYSLVQVAIVEERPDSFLVRSYALQAGDEIAADARHWRLRFEPPDYRDYYSSLANPIIVLFLGGFFLAAAAVKFGLDQNLTRIILDVFGSKSESVLLGLLLTTAGLSAFMSNTACTAMMVTIVVPIVRQLGKDDPLRYALMLAIPCGANIGGIATPIGTPPNAVVYGALSQQGVTIGFLNWMLLAVPLVVLTLFVTWRALLRFYPPQTPKLDLSVDARWDTSLPAIATYVVFALTVLLWMTDSIHGIPAAVVAFLPIGLFPLFRVIEKQDARAFSWDVLWLVAGGLSLGITTGMGPAQWIIGQIDWSGLPGFLILALLGLLAYALSNLISNTVAAAMIIPIAISLVTSGAVDAGFDIVGVCLTIGMVVSFSMLLPISTPPNAIALATEVIESKHLMKIGVVVGVVGIVMTLLADALYWHLILDGLVQA